MPNSEILLYQTEDGVTRLQVRFGEETVWLSQRQMAELFEKDVRTINEHIQNIFEERELDEDSVIRKFRITAADGKSYDTLHYSLDVIISVGYRVKSLRGTQFRRWATAQLREFLVKGFLLNDDRFKENGGDRHFEELLQRIRDIRSSEKVFWRKVLEIYATSEDYDKDAEVTQRFFATVQNKMHWAAHGHTAAEVVMERADAAKPNMGMTNFPGDRALKSDARIAKSYLTAEELDVLNRIVSMYLDFAELQAIRRIPMTMAAWIAKLDDFLRISDRDILTHSGRVSREAADRKADEEYERWRTLEANRESVVERDFDQAVEAGKKLAKERKLK